MSKYSDLINEARKSEKPKSHSKGSDDSVKPIKKEKQNSIILENNNRKGAVQKAEENLVGISIKVPENQRRHWATESKRTGKSMTSVIIDALTKEFGEP